MPLKHWKKYMELARPEDVIFEAIGHCYDKLKNYAQARFYYRKASHLNPEDSKLFYKIAGTYFNEEQLGTGCIKQLETAMKIHRNYSLNSTWPWVNVRCNLG